MRELIVGSRGSKLALVQTNWAVDQIKLHNPDITVRVEVIRTQGDKILDVPLAKIGDKGLFVKELEQALLDGQIDLAVHSMKDLPTLVPEGLDILAIPERVDPSDMLLSKHGGLSSLPEGARVGSSSLRRRAHLLHFRPDLQIVDLRGNVDTRVAKLQDGEFDAIVLAYAGLIRLGWAEDLCGASGTCTRDTNILLEKISSDISLHAVGQGALAIQGRLDDDFVLPLVEFMDDPSTRAAVTAERTLMKRLEGGCQVPVGAAAHFEDGRLRLVAMVASLDGKILVRKERFGAAADPEGLGNSVADMLLGAGAREILDVVRNGTGPTSMGAG